MPRSPAAELLWIAARAIPPDGSERDPQLLREFLASRCEAAFEELVRRHGPMVFGVCRRILGHTQDAEDAFQAAFLVLARKAATVRGANLAGWLYRIAVRTAQGVRIVRNRRRKRDAAVRTGRLGPPGSPDAPTADAPEHRELVAILDAELDRLPEHYRLPVVLCELQGRSRKEAAAELKIPEGTLSSRLATAKRKLADRLGRRGVTATTAALTAVFAEHATARVPAGLVRIATGSLPGTAAAVQTADGVVRSLFVSQLKGVLAAMGLTATLACGAVLMSGGGGGAALASPDEPKPVPVDAVAGLVRQLGDPAFATREAAGKQLRALGAAARPALRAAQRDQDPEVVRRAGAVLTAIRADARDALAKQFDPKGTVKYDHPVWQRFVAIAGDSPASRELFARIIANEKWLRTLDKAEADPTSAGRVYRVAIAEVFRDFNSDPAESPHWPCNRGEEVAYLLLLGSYPDTPPAKLVRDEVVPKNLRNTTFYGRGIIHGEGQITHARGLPLGLDGKLLDTGKGINPPAVAGAAGTDRVFARLFAAWFIRRDPSSEVVPPSFRIASLQRVPEFLPLARRFAANDFDPKREVPPNATIAALEVVARLGTRADLPLFERHFGDETKVATEKETRDFLPLPPPNTTQLRDVALGLAVLLHGGNPEDFGFFVRKGAFKRNAGRYEIPWYSHFHLGFGSEAGRTAAFKEAKAWLAEQRPKVEPPVAPTPGVLHRLDGHTNVVGGVAFFPTGERLVTSGFDTTYRIWDAKTGKELDSRSTGQKDSQVGGPVAVSPDGKRIAARYFVAEAETGKFLFGLEGHVAEITRIRYDREGKRILTASYDGTIRVWAADTGKPVRTIEAHVGHRLPAGPRSGFGPPGLGQIEGRGVRDVAFSADGKRIVSGGIDGMIRMWDADTGKQLWGWKQSQDVLAVAFLSDGKRAASGGAEGIIRIWDAAEGKELRRLTGHTGGVDALAVSPDGRLVSAGADKTVRVWDVETGRELRRFRGHTAAVRALAVSPDGRTALSGGEDNTARLWALPAIER